MSNIILHVTYFGKGSKDFILDTTAALSWTFKLIERGGGGGGGGGREEREGELERREGEERR